MKHDLQEYYEGLVAVQSDSIKRFLSRHGLLRYDKAFSWLDESDRKYIINGFDKGIKLRADYVFNKLRKTYKIQQQNETPAPPVKQQQKRYCIEFKPLNIELQHSELLLLQEYCVESIKDLSRSSRKVLSANEIFGIEQILPYIKGEKRLAELLKSAPNRKTKMELYRMFRLIRQEVEEARKTPRKQVVSIDLSKKEEPQDVFMDAAADSQLEPNNNRQLSQKDAVDIMERVFVEWQNELSVRARNVLRGNRITSYKELKSLSEKEYFSFKDLKNCGAKTAKELTEMFAALKVQEPSAIVKDDDKAVDLNIYERAITSFRLSVRTRNCLKEAEIKTIGDLVSFSKDDILHLKNVGRKTIEELEMLLKDLNLSFGTGASLGGVNKDIDPSFDLALSGFSKIDIEFALYFKEKYGYLPMLFLLFKKISTLPEYYGKIFKLYYGIMGERSNPLSLDEIARFFLLTSENVSQMLAKAQSRFVSVTKHLRYQEDWVHYGLDNIPVFIWNATHEQQQMLIREESAMVSFARKIGSKEELDSFLYEKPVIDEHLFKVLLTGWGMRLYWVDFSNHEIQSYTPLKNSSSFGKRPKRDVRLIKIDNRRVFLTNSQLESFKFNKAIKEVSRLFKVKTEENILIPIKSCFIDNSDYWSSEKKLTDDEKNSLECLLTNLFEEICDAHIDNGNLFVKANKTDYGQLAYEILKIAGKRLHRDDLFTRLNKVCEEKGLSVLVDPLRFSAFLSKDSRIVTYGKSSFWGLKEWGEITGSIREIAIEMVRKSKEPIQIEDLTNRILLLRPDSAFDNVATIIRQSVYMGEFVLFFDDYIGLKGKEYDDKYVIYPTSFDEWVNTYKQFVQINRHLPYCGQNGYEGYLYRWHYKASQLTDLSTEEILKFDALEKELAHYPQNATEYNFLQNCNLYKKFVESNQRMLTKEDDSDLFNWFYKYSRSYSSFDDNRNKYFGQLIQYISKVLY